MKSLNTADSTLSISRNFRLCSIYWVPLVLKNFTLYRRISHILSRDIFQGRKSIFEEGKNVTNTICNRETGNLFNMNGEFTCSVVLHHRRVFSISSHFHLPTYLPTYLLIIHLLLSQMSNETNLGNHISASFRMWWTINESKNFLMFVINWL